MRQKIPSRRPTTDLWHVGIVRKAAGALLAPDALRAEDILWLPPQGDFRFIADPFGIRHGEGRFTVLAEALDYRKKRGEIHYFTYDASLTLEASGVALQLPFHLSYPFVIEDGGQIYLLPEAHRSGRLTLYRAVDFPRRWEPAATLLELPAIDASVVRHQNRWWMFYSLPGAEGRALRELHIAYADALTGPWTQHAANPVRTGVQSSRPGGTPFVHEGALYLPTQECVAGYGDAINLLRIDTLSPDRFEAQVVRRIGPEGLCEGYADGLHTFSTCGELTLIDVKRVHRSHRRRLINLERRLRRLVGAA